MNVSVIIPAYNAAATLAEAIESIVKQTVANWEVIVINDGSLDRTSEIAGSFEVRDSRIRLINQPNGGEAAARNAGLAAARYDWLVFLDSDDWVAPTYIERLTAVLTADPALDAVHCAWARVASDGTEVVDDYRPPTGDLFPVLARRAAFAVHACMVRKSLVETVGGFDPTLVKCPDWDLWQRVARAGARFGSVPELLAYYRMSPNSASLEADQLFRDGLTVLRRGHQRDDRVPNPRDEYINGLTDSTVESQEFYLLSWNAGLLIGAGVDARRLLSLVSGETFSGLYANGVAQSVFEAATLPSGRARDAWEKLWPEIHGLAELFFEALEEQSKTANLARDASEELKRLVLRHSPSWHSVIEHDERTATDLRSTVSRLEADNALLWSVEAQRQSKVAGLQTTVAELESALAGSEKRADSLEAETALIEAVLQESRERVRTLEVEMADLWKSLGRSEARAESLEAQVDTFEKRVRDQNAELLAVERETYARRIEELERREAAVIRELANATRKTDESELREAKLNREVSGLTAEIQDLRRVAGLTEQELAESRRGAARLDQENGHLGAELSKWRRSSEQRGVLIEEMQQDTWARLGQLVGFVRRRAIAPATLARSDAVPDERIDLDQTGTVPDWELHVGEGSEAHLVFPGKDHQMVKVGISRVKNQTDWDIQLNRRGLKVATGGRYTLVFRARAARPRSIGVGFAKSYDPWSTVGLYTKVQLAPEWKTFCEEFVAPEDEENGRIHFDLGGKSIDVELTGVSFERVDSELETSASPAHSSAAGGPLA